MPQNPRADTRYLFVYGTLMSGAGTALGKSQRLRLARESDSLGPASIAHAHLYDLGRYPGAIAAGGVDDLVHGEAVLLSDPLPTLVWLDAYEGVGPREESEYDRVVRDVKLAGGEAIEAWVYLLRAAPPGARRLEDGRWMPR
ncbi:MAG: gamma-glutamylcyclotransferase family protein [Hyphomicrobium sp.]